MLEKIVSVVIVVLTSLVALLPNSPIDFSTYLSSFSTMMGYINWFIPFYRFRTIANAYMLVFFGSIAVVFIIKFVIKKLGR